MTTYTTRDEAIEFEITAATFYAMLTVFTVAACGGDTSDTTPTTSSEQVGQGMARYETADDLRAQLDTSTWSCETWERTDDGARCQFPDSALTHVVFMVDDAEAMAAAWLDTDVDSEAVIQGENWVFTCGDPEFFSTEDCTLVANVLHGTVKQRGDFA